MNKIEGLQQELTDLANRKYKTSIIFEERITAVKMELDEEIQKTLPQPIWGWECTPSIQKKNEYFSDAPEGAELLRVIRIITNLDEIQQKWDEVDITVLNFDQHGRGITFFRKNNVLLTTGGGTNLLYNGVNGRYPIVLNKDWAMMVAGTIPLYLLNEETEKKYENHLR